MTNQNQNSNYTSAEDSFAEQIETNRKKIEELKAENDNLTKSAKAFATRTVVGLIIKFELPIEDIQNKIASMVIKKKSAKSSTRKKAAPKYRNPDDLSQVWNGSGRAPKWITNLKELGTLESALIPVK